MMERREFITLVGGATAAWPLTARAQPSAEHRIGVLMARTESDPEGQRHALALQRGLEELGWLSGRNLRIEYRWPAGNIGLAQTYAKALVELRTDVLVANGTPSLAAARGATSTIPVVFVAVADPVAQGFVQSLARPGGIVTGFGAEEPGLGGKWVQLLAEIAPAIRSVTIIFNPNTAPFAPMFFPSMQAVRPSSSFELIVSPVHNEAEVELAIKAAGRRSDPGLIVLPDSFLGARHEMIVALVAKERLPAIYPVSEFSRSGGLIAYGIDRADLFRRSAAYVDRILKGEKPADLPVQLPAKFELLVNLKTAKALGLTVPLTLLALADEVIE